MTKDTLGILQKHVLINGLDHLGEQHSLFTPFLQTAGGKNGLRETLMVSKSFIYILKSLYQKLHQMQRTEHPKCKKQNIDNEQEYGWLIQCRDAILPGYQQRWY